MRRINSNTLSENRLDATHINSRSTIGHFNSRLYLSQLGVKIEGEELEKVNDLWTPPGAKEYK